MLSNLLEDIIIKGLVDKVIPPIQRYFTYFFIIIGIMWLGGANYYYYAEDCTKFKAALITGLVFFVLASMTALWEYYTKRKKCTENNFNKMAVKALPIVLPLLYNIFKNITIKPNKLKVLVVVGFIGVSIYYALRNFNWAAKKK